VIAQKIWEKGEVDIVTAILTHAEENDLDACFSVFPHDAAGDNIFDEAIRAADSDLEDLIYFIQGTVMMQGIRVK
jgi:hypothetical protein